MTISISEQEGDDIVPPWMLEEVLGVRYSREQAVSASALYQVTSSAPPHMILHGTNDHTVPMEQSVAYYEKLVEQGVRADLIEIERAQHGDDLFCQNQVKDKVIAFMRGIAGSW
ncbi:MAG: prolyl oligopeptidase family serine peptidase [Lachnospiraceae bacterium]|jgi:dipeptidyl aminopeptidase/acylaminoacyl peptidase|nr:prolyl oligopeptidase family serine peptidase [Lachnospiraceae bacterium]